MGKWENSKAERNRTSLQHYAIHAPVSSRNSRAKENNLLLETGYAKITCDLKSQAKKARVNMQFIKCFGLPSRGRWWGSRSSLCTSSSATLSGDWRRETGRVITLLLPFSPSVQLNEISWRDRFGKLTHSPVTFLVQVPTPLCAMLLVPLRLVQTVRGTLSHLGILQSRRTMHVIAYVHLSVKEKKKGDRKWLFPGSKEWKNLHSYAVTSFEETDTVDVPEPLERRPHSQTLQIWGK